jgi:uncharacterized membrane protein
MNSLMEISAGVGIANVVLLIALLTVYAKVYKSTRAVFTIGLMFFAGMLMLHNIIAIFRGDTYSRTSRNSSITQSYPIVDF